VVFGPRVIALTLTQMRLAAPKFDSNFESRKNLSFWSFGRHHKLAEERAPTRRIDDA
jgi:hypothetical protein